MKRSLVALLLVIETTRQALAFGKYAQGTPGGEVVGDYLRPNVGAATILRARGYRANEFHFFTRDGYNLTIVRGTNPLFNEGRHGLKHTLPILFLHGTTISSSCFVAYSVGAKPRNYRKRVKLDVDSNAEEVFKKLKDEPGTKNLPFLAMNFGYEIWLVDRRGFGQSRGKLGNENRTLMDAIEAIPEEMLMDGYYPLSGLIPKRRGKVVRKRSTDLEVQSFFDALNPKSALWNFWRDILQLGVSLKNLPAALVDFGDFQRQFIQNFDPDYWDFSLDEQAEYDVTDSINFVLRHSGKPRLHTVGLSSGGALLLMAASEQLELNDKIASAVLWAPSLNMGTYQDIVYQLGLIFRIAQPYSGPIVFTFMQDQVGGLLQTICSTDWMQRNLCARVADLIFGFSGHQEPMRQSALATLFASTSAHELWQLAQFSHTAKPCYFQFPRPKRNLEVYGKLTPPCYDLSWVSLKYISIYSGNHDILVSQASVATTRKQLGVPSKLIFLDKPGLHFNHAGSILHDETDRLVLIPSLIDFVRAENGVTTLNLTNKHSRPKGPFKRRFTFKLKERH